MEWNLLICIITALMPSVGWPRQHTQDTVVPRQAPVLGRTAIHSFCIKQSVGIFFGLESVLTLPVHPAGHS